MRVGLRLRLFMDLELTDKVVMLAGRATGIGAAIAHAVAAEGAVTVIVDSDVEAGNLLHSQLPGSELIIAERASAEGCYAAVDRTAKRFERIDVLVNSSSWLDHKIGREHGNPDQYIESVERNLLHYYNMAHFALPYLKKSRGNIVNVASKSDSGGQGRSSEYASVRGAILALTREWAAELAKYGIRVNAIVPVEAITPLYPQPRNTFSEPEERLQPIPGKIPLEKRTTTQEEIAAIVLFLLSPRAAHITAQHIFVSDGGAQSGPSLAGAAQ